MIKILKEGTLKTHTCTECGTFFQYDTNEDIEVKRYHASLNPYSSTLNSLVREQYIIKGGCPSCKKQIVIYELGTKGYC